MMTIVMNSQWSSSHGDWLLRIDCTIANAVVIIGLCCILVDAFTAVTLVG
jgi:hypothetical protein